jgi:hypothetical protein
MHPGAAVARIIGMDKHSEPAANPRNLAGHAAACRAQADHFSKPERDLLVNIANTFDEMSLAADIRRAVAATRCW